MYYCKYCLLLNMFLIKFGLLETFWIWEMFNMNSICVERWSRCKTKNTKITCYRYNILHWTFCSEMFPLKYEWADMEEMFNGALLQLQLPLNPKINFISRKKTWSKLIFILWMIFPLLYFPHLYFDLILCEWKMFSQLFLPTPSSQICLNERSH